VIYWFYHKKRSVTYVASCSSKALYGPPIGPPFALSLPSTSHTLQAPLMPSNSGFRTTRSRTSQALQLPSPCTWALSQLWRLGTECRGGKLHHAVPHESFQGLWIIQILQLALRGLCTVGALLHTQSRRFRLDLPHPTPKVRNVLQVKTKQSWQLHYTLFCGMCCFLNTWLAEQIPQTPIYSL
jgi:hypothetical protein